MLQKNLTKLNKMEEKKEKAKGIATLNTRENNVADPIGVLREISRMKDEIRRLK